MLNKVTLIGRIGADPEVRYTPSGDAIATIRLATTRRWKDRNTNERKEETEWHRVVFFGNTAKMVGEHLKKGSQIYVEGRLRTQKWQDKSGADRYTTEIVANEMHFLDRKEGGQNAGHSSGQNTGQNSSAPEHDDYFDDDDIPFMSLNSLIKNHLI